jgi:hypothetical protein
MGLGGGRLQALGELGILELGKSELDSQQPTAIARRRSSFERSTLDLQLSTFKGPLNVESRKSIDGGAQRRYNLDVERWLSAVDC